MNGMALLLFGLVPSCLILLSCQRSLLRFAALPAALSYKQHHIISRREFKDPIRFPAP